MENLADLTVAVLAGGFGTRLRSVVADQPKVLAAVNGRPFLAFLLEQLVAAGISRAVVCTGYLGEQVQAEFGSSFGSLRLSYSQEPSPLGTGGALRLAMAQFESETILVMNGDSFCQTNLDHLWMFHSAHRAEASLVLTHVQDSGRYGQVRIDDTGQIHGFDEKSEATEHGWINAGIYLINRKLLETIALGREVSLEREVFPSWVQRRFFGFINDGRFLDIGTPKSYVEAQTFFSQHTEGTHRREQ
jgi:D-glycero-alpha-D-manno-heptose 1-phosphate guanylyltransferase